ncbi:MAG: vitamin K epoxide reductase family protein [Candidatus Pacebacteria bacterium]|nr:vitamin K epoxide reductase family protein [Candidatus Paceibacterota bacterium]MCF7862455.1 vitamin K epoxide reductase family protein [Candidatus Paceibacterota bacterium]
MIEQDYFLSRLGMLIFAIVGFFIAKYIYNTKKENKPLVCAVGFDCNGVVNSRFSKLFGIPVEFFGMLYYALMSIAYLALLFIPASSLSPLIILFLAFAPMSAFIFSLYLLFAQVFVLKKGCSWCFISSFVCICIFILTLFVYDISGALQSFLN